MLFRRTYNGLLRLTKDVARAFGCVILVLDAVLLIVFLVRFEDPVFQLLAGPAIVGFAVLGVTAIGRAGQSRNITIADIVSQLAVLFGVVGGWIENANDTLGAWLIGLAAVAFAFFQTRAQWLTHELKNRDIWWVIAGGILLIIIAAPVTRALMDI